MKPHLDIAILTNSQAFKALEEEWEDLCHNSPLSTPFQSWSFLYSWWEHFGEGYQLRIITVRDEGLLVGLMPLMLERRWGFLRKLLFIGKFSKLDLLARKGWEDEVSEAGVRALRHMMGSWHVIDLQALSPVAAAWDIFQQWNGPRTYTPIAYYQHIAVKPWDKLLASLSRNHRCSVRRTLRRAEGDGVRSVLAGPEEAEQAARRLVALHRELWQGRNINQEHLTSGYESFIVSAARRMTDRGLGGISELRRDGEVIMSSFAAFGDKFTDAYLVGASQEARQRYQWSSLGICDALNTARSRNSAYLCLSSGREPFKLRWAPEEVPYYRIIAGGDTALGSLYWAYLSGRARGASHIKALLTLTTYKWIKNTTEWPKRLIQKGVH
jgi:CelD/BcsL family acetyltransferase involved in cellulose biosynthesis